MAYSVTSFPGGVVVLLVPSYMFMDKYVHQGFIFLLNLRTELNSESYFVSFNREFFQHDSMFEDFFGMFSLFIYVDTSVSLSITNQ